eukprot:CAMPEP_0179139318 /NCGR_PEP_ID=MMETSP0796-20121207/66629_1 /TAXON_ID=73915 /ORGANISM="Pyrodinium bahamense, Strain pbaha01" /LENGTH=88 /DNA_ID=CAMNT_0020838747 /DNA_START=47 /DNA_END=309 /DNA_ORIENTATION=-
MPTRTSTCEKQPVQVAELYMYRPHNRDMRHSLPAKNNELPLKTAPQVNHPGWKGSMLESNANQVLEVIAFRPIGLHAHLSCRTSAPFP